MERDGFPITLWPGVPVPELPVLCQSIRQLGQDRYELGESIGFRALPREFVLRELLDLDVDAATSTDLAEFLEAHGWLWSRFSADGLGLDPPGSRDVTWTDAAWVLRTMQSLVRTWLAFEEEEDLTAAWVGHPIYFPGTDLDAWRWFTTWLNEGLKAYPMRAELLASDLGYGDVPLGTPWVGLFSASCIQLANVLADQVPPHRCHNERCGRPFIRQRGGAEHGQYHTTGVLYCSQKCQRAQATREWRRRKAAR